MSKLILPIIFLLFTIFNANSQDFCGTEMPDVYKQHLIKKDRAHLFSNASRSTYQVPVQYHIVGTDDGQGYFTLSELVSLHCDLNANFTGTDIQFYLYDEVRYINSDEWYEFSNFSQGSDMMDANNIDDVCNIYITEDPRGVCGYAFFPGSGPSGGGIVLNKGCSSYGSTTLSHEMGHYLGLPHTFATIGGVEFVNGNNCFSTGDLFCDTPADFIDDRWQCPYLGIETDPNGDLYATVIDESLFMSYSYDNCQNRFSSMQESDMNFNLPNERPYLLSHPVPLYANLDSVILNHPVQSVSTVNAASTILDWDEVQGADFYHVVVIHFINKVDYDVFVYGTSLQIDSLIPAVAYRWKVKPISWANLCSDYSKEEVFITSEIMADAAVTPPDCKGNSNGEIEIIPSTGTAPYFFQWSNGAITNPVYNMKGGTYDVTVTDSDGNTVILNYELIEPENISIDFVIDDNAVEVNVEGGTPPYTYLWSDGSTTDIITAEIGSSYVVNITDSKGCSASKSILVSSINEPVTEDNSVSVYPNPVASDDFMAKVMVSVSDNYTVDIFSIDGRILYSLEKYLPKGSHDLMIPVEDWTSGLYFISLSNKIERSVNRFAVVE